MLKGGFLVLPRSKIVLSIFIWAQDHLSGNWFTTFERLSPIPTTASHWREWQGGVTRRTAS